MTWRERMWPITGAVTLVLVALGAARVARPLTLLWVLIGWLVVAVLVGLRPRP